MENSTLSRDELSTSDWKHVWYMIPAERGSHNYCRSWKSRLCFLQYGGKINLWSSLGYMQLYWWTDGLLRLINVCKCGDVLLSFSVCLSGKKLPCYHCIARLCGIGVIVLLLSTWFRQAVSASCPTSPSHLCYRATLTASYSLFVPDSKEYITGHCCIPPDCFRMDSNAYPLIIILLENAILNNWIIVYVNLNIIQYIDVYMYAHYRSNVWGQNYNFFYLTRLHYLYQNVKTFTLLQNISFSNK